MLFGSSIIGRAPVAKLQSSPDIVTGLLIRGMDEYATDRKCCPQQADAG
jgi:hypothetical protein